MREALVSAYWDNVALLLRQVEAEATEAQYYLEQALKSKEEADEFLAKNSIFLHNN